MAADAHVPCVWPSIASWPIGIVVLLLLAVTACLGCRAAPMHITPRNVLFDDRGEERLFPTADLIGRISEASAGDRRAMIAAIARELPHARGYAKVVMAKALVSVFESGPSSYSFITQEVVDVLAATCLRVSEMEPVAIYEQMVRSPIGWYSKPVDIAWEVEVDGFSIRLCRVWIPRDWRIAHIKVYLDGNLVQEDPEAHELGVLIVPITEYLSGEELLGRHAWRSELDLVAPNGVSSHIGRTWTFTVCREVDVFKGPL